MLPNHECKPERTARRGQMQSTSSFGAHVCGSLAAAGRTRAVTGYDKNDINVQRYRLVPDGIPFVVYVVFVVAPAWPTVGGISICRCGQGWRGWSSCCRPIVIGFIDFVANSVPSRAPHCAQRFQACVRGRAAFTPLGAVIFTEGFDTRDLRDAKALPEELA
jgi:hypothetical protein